jgi:hypothetical protein
MPELDETTLKALISQLDEGVPREGAIILEDEGGSYGDASRVLTANRRGYLRLGVGPGTAPGPILSSPGVDGPSVRRGDRLPLQADDGAPSRGEIDAER